jgi:hypothetical protein
MKLATAVNLAVHTPLCLPASGKDFTGRLTFLFFYVFMANRVVRSEFYPGKILASLIQKSVYKYMYIFHSFTLIKQ